MYLVNVLPEPRLYHSVIVQVDSLPECDHWSWTLLVSLPGKCIGHFVIYLHHHGHNIKPLTILSEHFTELWNIPGTMHLAPPANITWWGTVTKKLDRNTSTWSLCQAGSPGDCASGCLIFGGRTIGIQVWCQFYFVQVLAQKQTKKKNRKKNTSALERKNFKIAIQFTWTKITNFIIIIIITKHVENKNKLSQ